MGFIKSFLDLPSILNEAIKPSLVDIESERAKAQRLAEYYTAILRNEEENTTPKLRGINSPYFHIIFFC